MTIRTGCVMVMALSCMAMGCTDENYDTGDGKYSYMRTDFVEAHVDANRSVDFLVTDEGVRLVPTSTCAGSWITRPDTVYRAIFYYNVNEKPVVSSQVEPLALSPVPVLRPYPEGTFKEMKTDPVAFESAWMSASGTYVNLGLLLMSGKPDAEDAAQAVGLVDYGTVEHADGHTCAHACLYHDQGNVPEYYYNRQYVSIPMEKFTADTLRLTINTYSGVVEKTFPLIDVK
ncbi:MAG: hypothetical protein ACI350_06950 [Prevotella sp.]